jgi:hypothetical protein
VVPEDTFQCCFNFFTTDAKRRTEQKLRDKLCVCVYHVAPGPFILITKAITNNAKFISAFIYSTMSINKYSNALRKSVMRGAYSHKSSCLNIYTWTRLRHCATSRKVTGSIPGGITGIFQRLNPSGRTVALGSTQPLAEMSTRNPSCG